jgi:protein-S-isoprenylcysteine O-methyltransferase Ste14
MMLARALFAFLLLPGLVAFVAPLIIASFDKWRGEVFLPGLFVMFVGIVVLVWCVRDVYVSGKGTLAPWSPPKHLVVVGLYRYVRNPMYLGVLILIVGWGLYLLSLLVAVYAILLSVGFHLRVLLYEEPWCASQFGESWKVYKATVPRWIPRGKASKA